MGMLEILIIVFVLAPLAGAVAHRIQQGSGDDSETAGELAGDPESVASRQEIRELRQEVGRLSDRVERLVQQQDFLERLLEERPADRPDAAERKPAP